MNQILLTCGKNKDFTKSHHKNKKKSTFFKIQFIVCTIIAISITSYYTYSSYINNKKESVSQKLTNNFNITTLYNDDPNYSTKQTSSREYVYS